MLCILLSPDFIKKISMEEHETEHSLKEKIIEKCEELLPRDIQDNRSMGQHGASHILNSKPASLLKATAFFILHTSRHYERPESSGFDTLQYWLISHRRIRNCFGRYQSST